MKITRRHIRSLIRDMIVSEGRLPGSPYAPDQAAEHYNISDWVVENILYNDEYSSHRKDIGMQLYSGAWAGAKERVEIYLQALYADPDTAELLAQTDHGIDTVNPSIVARAMIFGPDMGYSGGNMKQKYVWSQYQKGGEEKFGWWKKAREELVQKDPLESGTVDLRGVDVTPQSIARLKRGLSTGDWEDK